MKISKSEYGRAAANPVGEQKILPEQRPRTKAQRCAVEKSQLTPLEQGILTAEEALRNTPDVREEIVARLKESIDKGEYSVNGEEVADMMIRRLRADRVR